MAIRSLKNGTFSRSLLVGNAFYEPPGNFNLIETYTVGAGGTSSISFSSIPSTFKHLQVRFIARGTRSSPEVNDYLNVRFNSDSANNYARHRFYSDGTTLAVNAASSIAQFYIENIPAAGSAANIFATGIMDILDYADTNKYKTSRFLVGKDENGSGYIMFHSSLWQSTSAINSITITPGVGPTITQYSRFSLYGISE